MSPIHDFTMMKTVPTIKKSFSSSKLLLFVTYDLTIAEEGGMEN
jgi:hypothetical protein